MRIIALIAILALSACGGNSSIRPKISIIKIPDVPRILAGEIACITEEGNFYSLPLRKDENPNCISFTYTPVAHNKSLRRFRMYRDSYAAQREVVERNNERAK